MNIYVIKVTYKDMQYYISSLFNIYQNIIGLTEGIDQTTKTYTSRNTASKDMEVLKKHGKLNSKSDKWLLVYLSDAPNDFLDRDQIKNWPRKILNEEAYKIIDSMEVDVEEGAIQFSTYVSGTKIGWRVARDLTSPCIMCGIYPNRIPILKKSRICIFCMQELINEGCQLLNANLTTKEIDKIKKERLIRKLKE